VAAGEFARCPARQYHDGVSREQLITEQVRRVNDTKRVVEQAASIENQ
jgi:hypothetical protein